MVHHPQAVCIGGVGLWPARLLPRLRTQPCGLPFWGTSFPLAAFAALSLRLAAGSDVALGRPGAIAALAVATTVIAALVLLTLRGLVNGSLLVPEPTPPTPAGPGPVHR